ncbi:hypothetical protein SynRS9902_02582 [Synechococcus sp. RS9902]|nr:hypothetical protein SynRS9902_02582 [Synechococcus sp. RS9902]
MIGKHGHLIKRLADIHVFVGELRYNVKISATWFIFSS